MNLKKAQPVKKNSSGNCSLGVWCAVGYRMRSIGSTSSVDLQSKYTSCPRNQQCEPKKISVQKNPETTTVSGFFRYEKIINQDDAGVMSPRANNSKVVSEANSRAVVNDRLTARSPFVALRHFPHTVGDSTVDCQSGVGRHVQQTLRTEGLFADFGAF